MTPAEIRSQPAVREPRERTAAGIGVTAGLAGLLWTLHIALKVADHSLAATAATTAGVASVATIVAITCYIVLKSGASNTRLILTRLEDLAERVDQLTEENEAVRAELHGLKIALNNEHRHQLLKHIDDNADTDIDMTNVTQFRGLRS